MLKNKKKLVLIKYAEKIITIGLAVTTGMYLLIIIVIFDVSSEIIGVIFD